MRLPLPLPFLALLVVAPTACDRSPSPLGADDRAASCKETGIRFDSTMRALDRSCERDEDCVASGLDWDPCSPAHAMRKGKLADDRRQRLTDLRAELWRLCDFVVAPCPAVPMTPKCEQRRCVLVEGMPASARPPREPVVPEKTLK